MILIWAHVHRQKKKYERKRGRDRDQTRNEKLIHSIIVHIKSVRKMYELWDRPFRFIYALIRINDTGRYNEA